MVPTHHAGKFLPKSRRLFPHDFTLIASVVGESVIGNGICGKYIPINMARLAESQSLESATTVYSKLMMALRSKYLNAMYYTEFPHREYPPAHQLKYLMSY